MYSNTDGSITLEIAEGDVFTCPSKTLTDAHFLFFSGISGDTHPSHYDVEYASQTRFGKPLAHGLLLASLTALGASDGQWKAHGFIFIEQGCRYLKPALVGDTMYPSLVVDRLWEEDGRTFCKLKTLLRNQRGEQLLEGFHLYRVLPVGTPTQHGDTHV